MWKIQEASAKGRSATTMLSRRLDMGRVRYVRGMTENGSPVAVTVCVSGPVCTGRIFVRRPLSVVMVSPVSGWSKVGYVAILLGVVLLVVPCRSLSLEIFGRNFLCGWFLLYILFILFLWLVSWRRWFILKKVLIWEDSWTARELSALFYVDNSTEGWDSGRPRTTDLKCGTYVVTKMITPFLGKWFMLKSRPPDELKNILHTTSCLKSSMKDHELESLFYTYWFLEHEKTSFCCGQQALGTLRSGRCRGRIPSRLYRWTQWTDLGSDSPFKVLQKLIMHLATVTSKDVYVPVAAYKKSFTVQRLRTA